MNKQWHDTPVPECECQVCDWCHDAYEHKWTDWNVSIDRWECHACQRQFEDMLDASLKSGECESHDARSGSNCAICQELSFKEKLDKSIDNDIEHSKEDKNANNE
jgi:hypothetical protein